MESHEYWEEISDLTNDLIAEMENHDQESWFAYMHETLDGHSFCIYTGESQDVIRHSNNDGAAAEDFGADGIVQDGQLNWGMMAYCAMECDVIEEIARTGYDINDDDTFGPRMKCSVCEERFKDEDMSVEDDNICDGCYEAAKNEEGNAGCDQCGVHDRMTNSKYCSECNPESTTDGICETCKGTKQIADFFHNKPCPDCGGK